MNKTRPFKKLISFEKAQDLIMNSIVPMNITVNIPLRKAQNRVLAQNVEAPLNVPPFNRAAMDGYAVKAEDTYGSSDLKQIILNRVGALYAGDKAEVNIEPGECVSIATGAMLPPNADSVVMIEYTEEHDDQVKIHKPVHPGENCSSKGSDISQGSVPLSTGMVLSTSRIGAAAAPGISSLEVFMKPKVAIAGSGNEICPLGQELAAGQVYDINSYTLASLILEAGGEPILLGLIEDTREALENAFDKALEIADMVVFSGGSSVGERDLLVDVFGSRGKVLFHGLTLKPGKPVLAAICNNKLCFGLPGYPTSCLTSALLLLSPVLRRLANKPEHWPRTVNAKLGRRVPSTLGRTQVLTIKLNKQIANPAFKESGAITSMAEADGYIVIPSNVDLIEKGEEIQVFLL